MKCIIKIFIFSVIFFFAGCENVSVVNPDINFKEYIVVRAELVADEDFTGVQFTRTQPLDQQYDSTTAAITSNVTAYMKINGVQVVPLHHFGNGIYMPIDRIRIQSGYTYELFADVNGVGVYSTTIVPEKPMVASAHFNPDTSFQANIYAIPGAVYGAAWEIYNSGTNNIIASAIDFKEIVQNSDKFNTSTIPVITMVIPNEYKSSNYFNQWYIRVYAYDPAYLPYFLTRNNNQPVSDVFSQGGDQIIWNVHGNGVIGLFIGVVAGDYVKVQ